MRSSGSETGAGTPEAAQPNLLKGVALAAGAFGMFSLQDAIVKWLVATFAVPQVLFMRSAVVIMIALLISGRGGFSRLVDSPNKLSLLARALLLLTAWLFYYGAARHLGLAELTTIYFVAPVIVVTLSVFILGEKVGAGRWLAVAMGFGGVLVASLPGASISLTPALMALAAAFCWALASILVRLISRSEATANQMLASNGFFLVVCAAMFPWIWTTPDAFSWLLFLALGLVGGLGQYFFFESFRFAPASAVAPVEYTALIWAVLLGYAIWRDVPSLNVFAGAGLIMLGSLLLLLSERRRRAA
jgi:S-adenosylmethionine uptake transporter